MEEKSKKIRQAVAILIIVSLFFICVYLIYTLTPIDEYRSNGRPFMGVDWRLAFRDASIRLLNGNNPYDNQFFFNPVWILFPLIPISFLSPELGSAVMFILSLFIYLFISVKLKIHAFLIPIFLIFSPLYINLVNGNIDAWIALGFILPPQLGLFFILAKPQLGIALAAFWAVEAYRKGKLKEVFRVFSPVTLAYILSFFIYGFYISGGKDLVNAHWNASIFPYGLLIGFPLLGLAIWRRDINFAISASPFFAVYLSPHGWTFAWLGLLAVISNIPWRLVSSNVLKRLTITKKIP